jgi:hypothetical protein
LKPALFGNLSEEEEWAVLLVCSLDFSFVVAAEGFFLECLHNRFSGDRDRGNRLTFLALPPMRSFFGAALSALRPAIAARAALAARTSTRQA